MTRPKSLIAIASATALFSLVTGCSEDQENAALDTPTSRPTPSPTEAAPTDRSQPPPAATTKPKPSVADNELNLAHDVIVRLGRAADAYGYGLGPGTTLDYEQATNFAYAVSLVCDGWRSGESTFQDSVDEDVASGAPLSDARGFNRFLQADFCPAYYEAGN